MTELFISYSRRNKEFTEEFIKSLAENNYPAERLWVDWNNIPPSSKWEDEIRKGIEAANAVIFILSPDWVISNECRKELQIAVEYNKRLFPIIHQNVDPKLSPPELASLNWIFYRETDDPKIALQKLLEAIDTDLDWVKQHTFLLKRSNEWNTKKQDPSYLLRGSELQDAELWLSKSSEAKVPHPTPLQNEYIFASRQDATRRQRNTLIGVSAALVVSILLAIAAVFGGVEAVRKSQQALASQLAAQSINFVDTQPDLSLLLSLESNYIADTLGDSDPARLGSLVTSINSVPQLDTYLRAHEGDIRSISFSADGHWVAATGNAINDTGIVTVWDLTSNESPIASQQFSGGTQRLLGVAFSPDSKRLAAVGDEKKIFVWNSETCCEPILEFDIDNKARNLEFVKLNGREFIAISAGSQITFWDASTGKKNEAIIFNIPTEDETVRILDIAISPANDMLAAGSEDGNITVWDLKTKETKFHACAFGDAETNEDSVCKLNGDGETDIRGVAFNTDGTLLASGSTDHRVWLWNTASGALLARSVGGNEGGHINTVSSVSFNPKTGQIASASWDNTVRIWQPIQNEDQTWQLELMDSLTGHSNSIWAAAYSPDGSQLATGSSDKTLILWNVEQASQLGTPFKKLDSAVWAMAVSPDGKHFAAADLSGYIHIWDFDGSELSNERELNHAGGVLSLIYSNNNKWLASSGYTDNAIRIWDAQTGKELWKINNAHASEIWSLAFSPDDRWLASASFDQTVKIWDTTTHKLLTDPIKHEDGVYTLTFNDSGSSLFVAGYSTDIFSYPLTNPVTIPTANLLTGHGSAVNLITPNPKYPEFLASTSDDKTLLVWDVNSGEHTPPVLGLNESMEAVAFRPSGDWMASATNNNTVLLWQFDAARCSKEWDKDTCQPQIIGTPLTGSDTAVYNVIFLSDTILISSSADGQLIQWNLEKADWYDIACGIVNRPLSDAEYRQYIGEQLNSTLLNAIIWVSERFGNEVPTPPSCLSADGASE